MRGSSPSRELGRTASIVIGNGIWAALITVWAQTAENLWLHTSVIKPEYVHAIRLGVSMAIVISMMLGLRDTTVASSAGSTSSDVSRPGQFTIRRLLIWTALLAVYCAVFRLAVRTDPFAPASNALPVQIMTSIRWQLWFLPIGIWSIFPTAWATTRRRSLSKQTWALVIAGTLISIITAFPLFSCLGRYLNGVWNNPQQRLLTGLLLPFLIGFIATALGNLFFLAKFGLLHRGASSTTAARLE